MWWWKLAYKFNSWFKLKPNPVTGAIGGRGTSHGTSESDWKHILGLPFGWAMKYIQGILKNGLSTFNMLRMPLAKPFHLALPILLSRHCEQNCCFNWLSWIGDLKITNSLAKSLISGIKSAMNPDGAKIKTVFMISYLFSIWLYKQS